MARVKKTYLDKEKELKQIISAAKKKLASIHNKLKTDIGDLAFKHGLHEFDLIKLENAFEKLAMQLSNEK